MNVRHSLSREAIICGFMVYTLKDLYVDLLWIYVDLFAPKWIYGVHNFGQMFTPRLFLNIFF